jgi:hypothetical protein
LRSRTSIYARRPGLARRGRRCTDPATELFAGWMTGYRGLPLVGRRSREARFDVRRGLPGWQGDRLALAETGMAAFRAFEGEADTGCKHKAVAFCWLSSALSPVCSAMKAMWICRSCASPSDQDGCVGVRQTILIQAFLPADMPWPAGSDTRD